MIMRKNLTETALKLEKSQRIFVNRSLNMKSIKSIGYDMDHTLAPYNRANFEAIAFRATLEKFIDAGYPQELNELNFDPNFVIRGLLVDKERGNLLKVDGHKYVKLAFHGRRPLDKQERHILYNSESFKAHEFLSIDSFFALSEVQLFTEIVDYMRLNPRKIEKTFSEVYSDLRKFIDLSHQDGSIKNQVMAKPELYIVKEKYRCNALLRLIEAGKNLFLLTNSKWDYTDVIMSYLFENAHSDFKKWQDYFSQIIVGSKKPQFFIGDNPFELLEQSTGTSSEIGDTLVKGEIYNGGNAKLFQELTNQKGDEILYCGDHIYGDIIRSKETLNWRTLLVVEELDHELPILEQEKRAFEEIKDNMVIRESLDEELHRLRSLISSTAKQINLATIKNDKKKTSSLEKEINKYKDKQIIKEHEISELDYTINEKIRIRSNKIHDLWGELMKVGLEKSRFAQQVEEYACVYTSKVSNLRFYSARKKFSSPHDLMPHDV